MSVLTNCQICYNNQRLTSNFNLCWHSILVLKFLKQKEIKEFYGCLNKPEQSFYMAVLQFI